MALGQAERTLLELSDYLRFKHFLTETQFHFDALLYDLRQTASCGAPTSKHPSSTNIDCDHDFKDDLR